MELPSSFSPSVSFSGSPSSLTKSGFIPDHGQQTRHHRSTSDSQQFEVDQEAISKLDEQQPFAWVFKSFRKYLTEDANMAAAVAAVGALTEVIKVSKANTMMELEKELKTASDILQNCSHALSVASGCELFTRFVIRASGDYPDFSECKKKLIDNGELYVKQSEASRNKIGQFTDSFIRDGVTVLTHGYSRVVMAVLMRAINNGKRFSVIVTEARPGEIGILTAQKLQEAKVPVTLIMDSALAHVMERVDLVLVGAEGIVESGGIINKIGTFQVSVIASAFSKPFYVAAESFKFMRLYPLGQKDIAEIKKDKKRLNYYERNQPLNRNSSEDADNNKLKIENPSQDYTPPSYITLLFTELGVLTPAAVSDELIKLYY